MSHRRLVRSTPLEQGVAPGAVLTFVDAVETAGLELHSFMVLRHAAVVAEGWWAPYSADRRHELFSLSKAFTATAVGLARAQGLLALDDPVLGYFPDPWPR